MKQSIRLYRNLLVTFCIIFSMCGVSQVLAGYQTNKTRPTVIRKKIVHKKIKQKPTPPIKKNELKPNTKPLAVIKASRPLYNPKGKIDPFQPSITYDIGKRINPIPKYIDLSEFKVTGILTAESGNRALIQEASGKGYVVTKGSFLGNKKAKIVVKKILSDRILVEKTIKDEFNRGQFIVLKNELKLNKPL